MIYHLDVGAMYPNIILTNRLQVSHIVCMCFLTFSIFEGHILYTVYLLVYTVLVYKLRKFTTDTCTFIRRLYIMIYNLYINY